MEQNWIQSAQRGEEQAVTWLVETYQRPVYYLCFRMLGDADEAEDAAQEALIKAISHLSTFDLARPFRPWLFSIAANECVDRLRRQRPTVSLDGMGEDGAWEWKAGHSPDPQIYVEQQERQSQVQALLTTLPPTDRLLVTLFYWEELSYDEIAQVAGLTVSAVKSRLFRARRLMAQQWVKSAKEEAYV